MKINSSLAKERIYVGTSGKEINISFIPAICTKIYKDYIKLFYEVGQSALEQQNQLRNLQSKKDVDVEELSKNSEKLKQDAEEVNKLGQEIIEYAIEANKQTDVKDIDDVWKFFNVEEMKEIIEISCGVSDLDKKK